MDNGLLSFPAFSNVRRSSVIGKEHRVGRARTIAGVGAGGWIAATGTEGEIIAGYGKSVLTNIFAEARAIMSTSYRPYSGK